MQHHNACRMMLAVISSDGIFNSHRKTIMDYSSCIVFKFFLIALSNQFSHIILHFCQVILGSDPIDDVDVDFKPIKGTVTELLT